MGKIISFYYDKKKPINIVIIVLFVILLFIPISTRNRVEIGREYTDKEDVVLYIKTYHELPINYITHYGMETAFLHDGNLADKIIGGDTHWNNSALTDFGVSSNVYLKECDIKGSNYNVLSNRGRLRLVYTSNVKNVRVFFSDHYEIGTFEEITSFKLQLTSNIMWIVFSIYTIGCVVFFVYLYQHEKKISNC